MKVRIILEAVLRTLRGDDFSPRLQREVTRLHDALAEHGAVVMYRDDLVAIADALAHLATGRPNIVAAPLQRARETLDACPRTFRAGDRVTLRYGLHDALPGVVVEARWRGVYTPANLTGPQYHVRMASTGVVLGAWGDELSPDPAAGTEWRHAS